MKLRINNILRRALCVAKGCALGLTLSAASLSLPALLLTGIVVSSQAEAEVEQAAITGSSGLINAGGYSYSSGYILVNFTAGYFGGKQYMWEAPEIQIKNWNQTAGSSSEAIFVNGNLVDGDAEGGTGNIVFAVNQEMWHNHIFNGDHSGFSGDFIIALASRLPDDDDHDAKDFVFTNFEGTGTLTNVSGTGDIQMGLRDASSPYGANVADRDAIYYYTGEVSIGNSSIAARTLSLNGKNASANHDSVSLGNSTSDSNKADSLSTSYKTSRTANTGTDGATYTISSALTLDTLELNDGSTAILVGKPSEVEGGSLQTVASTIGAVTFAGNSALSIGDGAILTLTGATTVGTSHTLSVLTGGDLTIATDAALTINGRLNLETSFTNSGTVSFGADARIDLSDLTSTSGGDKISIYQIISADSTGSSSFTGLTWENILGIDGMTSSSHSVAFGDDGKTITITELIEILSFAGSADAETPASLGWNTTDADFTVGSGATAFEDNDIVSFSGHTSATLEANINADTLSVAADSSLSIADSGAFQLSANRVTIADDASMSIAHAALNVSGGALALAGQGSSSFELRGGNYALSSVLNLSAYSGELVLSEGTVSVGSANDFGSASTITLSGTTLTTTAAATYAQAINVDGTASIASSSGTATLNLLTGSADSTLNLSGSVYLKDVDFAGTINITNTTRWGTSQTSTERLAASHINVASGGTFDVLHGSGDYTGTAITLNGATLESDDLDTGTGVRFGQLTITDNSTIKHSWNGIFSFTNLTGDGNINYTPNTSTSEDGQLQIRSVTDYNGTITFSKGASDNEDKLYFSDAINQSAGHHMIVRGGLVEAENTTYNGEGTVSYEGGVRLVGATRLNSGTLNIGSYEQSATSNSFRVIGGRLNFTGASVDSANKVTIAIGGATLGASQDALSINESFNLGAYGEGTPGTAASPLYTTIDTTKSTGSGATAMTISGTVAQVSDSVGGIKVQGTGSLTLSGNNSFTGGVRIEGGTFIAGSATAAGTGTITVAGGSLNAGGQAMTNTVNVNSGSASGLSAFAGTLNVKTALTLTDGVSGTINVESGASLTLGGTWDYSSAISNSGSLTFDSSLQLDLTDVSFSEDSGTYSLNLFTSGSTADLTAWLSGGEVVTSKLTGVVTEGYTFSYNDGVLSYTAATTDIVIDPNENKPLASIVEGTITFEDSTGIAALGSGFAQGEDSTFIGEGTIQVTAGSSVTLDKASTGFTGTTTVAGDAASAQTVLNVGHADALGAGDVAIQANAQVVVEQGVTLSNDVNLTGGGSITTAVLTVTGRASGESSMEGGSITNSGTTGSIANAILTNTEVHLAATKEGSLTGTILTNTEVILEDYSEMTMSGVTQGIGSTVINNNATFNMIDHTIQVMTDNHLVNKGVIPGLKTGEGGTHDMLVFSLTSVDVTNVNVEGSLTLDIVLTGDDLAAFNTRWAMEDGIVAFQLAGVALTDLDFDYTGVTINVYEGVLNGTSLYAGTALGTTTYLDGENSYATFYIPEPSTASLSLLALVGLLARRRRQKA